MESIIFFTNEDKLAAVGVIFSKDLNDKNPNQFYQYNFGIDKSILLINDLVDAPSMLKILEQQRTILSLYYVFHTLPSDDVKTTIKDYCTQGNISLISQKDIHAIGKSKLYHLVGEFCDTNANLKQDFFDDLKKRFKYDEILERKLTLLHDCLHHESAANADITWLGKEQQELVEQLIKINDNMDENYIRILTQLRKDLLGS